MDIVVQTLCTYPEMNSSIKMEVGIEDCLHIEFEYNKSKYHLRDVIVGKIYFLLVRIKIKHMEIGIIKRESTGTGPSVYHENDTIAKYEIMDGAPVRGKAKPFEITLWRKGDIVRRSMSQQATIAAQRYEGSNSETVSAQAKEESN
ncbi:hypothetical protein cypCar_00002708 [Cyprinus carpio]|nr:hypothetical protein cypCar_00002708 [Cyprinus carpio]